MRKQQRPGADNFILFRPPVMIIPALCMAALVSWAIAEKHGFIWTGLISALISFPLYVGMSLFALAVVRWFSDTNEAQWTNAAGSSSGSRLGDGGHRNDHSRDLDGCCHGGCLRDAHRE